MSKPLVHRAARDQLARLLRQLATGQITNDVFCDATFQSCDPVIDAILDSAWVFYDDLKEHKLIGKHRLSHQDRRTIARWIVFLDSDQPYVWPKIALPGSDPHYRRRRTKLGARLSMFGLHTHSVDAFLAVGHYPVWPFQSMRDYKMALKRPRRLTGSEPL